MHNRGRSVGNTVTSGAREGARSIKRSKQSVDQRFMGGRGAQIGASARGEMISGTRGSFKERFYPLVLVFLVILQ